MPIELHDGTELAQGKGRELLGLPDEDTSDLDGSYSVWEEIGAAIDKESTFGAAIANDLNDAMYRPWQREEGFDIVSEYRGTKYEAFEDELLEIRNRKAWEMWKGQKDKEEKTERILQSGGISAMIAQLGAGILSPTTALPGGILARSAGLGFSAGKSALSVGAATGAAAAIDEGILRTQQLDRSMDETTAAIGGTVLLGALLGAGSAKFLTNRQFNDLANDLQDHIYSGEIEGEDIGQEIARYIGRPQPGGAAVNEVASLADNEIAGAAAQKLSRLTLSNPLLRGLRSPSRNVRDAVTKLVENPIYLKKNLDGHASATAVETAMKQWDRGALAQGMELYQFAYKQHRKTGGKLSQPEFAEKVSKAMRRGDVDADGDPHIEAAAKAWREKVFDPLKDLAIEAGLLPEDVKPEGAVSYLSRIYNKPMIEADEDGFKRVVREWAGGVIREDIQRLRSIGDRRVSDVDREIQELEVAILREEEMFSRRMQRKAANQLPDELEEEDLLSMIRVAQEGRPSQPETMVQWLHRKGGLFDDAGELRHLGINNQTRPGFVRKARRTAMDKDGGWDLDTAARMAWEEGFIRTPDRPDLREFLDALSDDFSKMRRVVRDIDDEAAAHANNYDDLIQALEDLDINIKDPDPTARFRTVEEALTSDGVLRRLVDARKNQMRTKIKRLQERLAEVEDELTQRPRMEDDIDFDDLAKAELEEEVESLVEGIWRKVTGRPDLEEETGLSAFKRRLPESKRGPIKQRTFNISDELIEPWLENNVEAVARRYVRVMSADVELTKNFGSANLDGLLKKISDDYEQLRALETDADKRQKLSKQEKADIEDINVVRDLLRGQFEPEKQATAFARVVNLANIFNYVRALGGVTVSSLPDLARPMMVHGLGRYMGDGVKPLLANRKAWSMSVKEAKLAGTVVERTLNSRLATWSEIADPYAQFSPFENFMQNTATVFSKLNGLTYWNDFMKSVASVMTQNRVIENLQDLSKLSAKEKRYMAYLGIDEATSASLQREIKQHATKVDGVWVANTEKWTKPEAVRLFRAALNKDVDSIIVTKGIGDVPVFAHTPAGRLLLQFKSFGLAAHQRVLMRGMQEDSKGMIAGLVFGTTIGAALSALKNIESNREISDNPGTWIAEGLDRSGIMTVLFEMNNIAEKVGATGIYGGLQKAFPDRDQKGRASRYATRNVVSSLLGPSIGPAEDFARLLYSINQGDLTPGDVTAIRRLMPYSTLWGIRSLLEYGVLPPLKEAVR